jgi:hypothetical protein
MLEYRVMRAAVLFLAFYIVFDIANPFVPGAFNFDPDTSIEATAEVTSVTQAPAAPLTRDMTAWSHQVPKADVTRPSRLLQPRITPVKNRSVFPRVSSLATPSSTDDPAH